MPKPNQVTTLRVEDFAAEQRAWLPRLFTPLNQFLTGTFNILNARVDFGANIPCLDQELLFNYGNEAQTFLWTQLPPPRILWVGQCLEDGDPVGLQPFWQYDASTNKLSVDFYKFDGSALTTGSFYKVFLRVVP